MKRLYARLALCLSRGLTVTRSLELEGSAAARKLRARVAEGASLGEALGSDLVRLGERFGRLEQALADLAAGGDARLLFVTWLERALAHAPFPEAFAACAPLLSLDARPATLLEAARTLPKVFPRPLDVAFEVENELEIQRGLLTRFVELRTSGLWGRDVLASAFAKLAFLIWAGQPLRRNLEGVAASLPKGKVASVLRAAADVDYPVRGYLSDAIEPLLTPTMKALLRQAEDCGKLDQAFLEVARGLKTGLFRGN
jgi:type II secretory pathway component PulF